MTRLHRRTIATRRVNVRYTETHTRTLSKRALQEMLEKDMTRMFAEKGIILTPDDIEQRGFKVSSSRTIYNDLETTPMYYEYDLTALI